jgi:hypothetical protein
MIYNPLRKNISAGRGLTGVVSSRPESFRVSISTKPCAQLLAQGSF